MTSYVPRTGGQKKKNILRQKELELRGAIHRGVATEKLQRSAEKVRSAQLGVIKALLEEARPLREEDEETSGRTVQNLREAREYWEGVSFDEIIQIYLEDTDETSFIERKKWWDFRPR